MTSSVTFRFTFQARRKKVAHRVIVNGALSDRGSSPRAQAEEMNALFVQVGSSLKIGSSPLARRCEALLLQCQVFFVLPPFGTHIRLVVKVRYIRCRVAFSQRLYTGKVFVYQSLGLLKVRAVSQRDDNGLHQGNFGCW